MSYINEISDWKVALGARRMPRLSMSAIGAISAWLAVLIYASSNSIITLLVDIGAANPQEDGRNAITYANLLFLGSMISLLPIALLYRRDLTRVNLRAMTRQNWGTLMVSAFLSSALTPGLFFYALERTSVTNMVLVGRIEPPLFLLATWLFLKERLDRWAMAAGLIALVGAMLIIGMRGDGAMFQFGKGEWATVGATLSFITSTLVTRKGLKAVPMGIFSVFRTVIGMALYFGLTTYLFGVEQFQDVFEPVMLKWVWVYAIIVIVLGQIAWNVGLKHARSADVSLATSFSPLAAIVIAMVLLGENPGPGLIPGAVIILIAICVGQFGQKLYEDAERHPADAPTGDMLQQRTMYHMDYVIGKSSSFVTSIVPVTSQLWDNRKWPGQRAPERYRDVGNIALLRRPSVLPSSGQR